MTLNNIIMLIVTDAQGFMAIKIFLGQGPLAAPYCYTPPPHPNIVQAPRLQTLVVVWLPLARLARAAPEGELAGGVGGRQPVQGVSVY